MSTPIHAGMWRSISSMTVWVLYPNEICVNERFGIFKESIVCNFLKVYLFYQEKF